MDKLVRLACAKKHECSEGCGNDCEYFLVIKEKLQRFGQLVSEGLAGRTVVIAELRQEKWYELAVRDLQWNGYVLWGNAFKKIEEELINDLLGLRAQK